MPKKENGPTLENIHEYFHLSAEACDLIRGLHRESLTRLAGWMLENFPRNHLIETSAIRAGFCVLGMDDKC